MDILAVLADLSIQTRLTIVGCVAVIENLALIVILCYSKRNLLTSKVIRVNKDTK